jgi:glyoxylase-like metal-dependent hydrolase (beta-lactamase superfamily II)
MICETVVVGPLEVNCYVLAAGPRKKAVIIDPGADEQAIRRVLARHALTPGLVVNTHGHFDHIGCDNCFGVPVMVHEADAGVLRDPRSNYSVLFSAPFRVTAPIETLVDGQRISLDGIELDVLHVPGHSAGGIALVLRKPETGAVFTGDSLFCGSIGRSDLGGDQEQLVRAIRSKLLTLDPGTAVYPGHGPASTIAQEKRSNPFVR